MFIYKFVSKFNNFDDSSTRILRRKKGLKDIASNVSTCFRGNFEISMEAKFSNRTSRKLVSRQ